MKLKIFSLLIFSCLTFNDLSFAIEKNRDYYEKRGEVIWEVPTDKKVNAFTFDDGPDPKYTPQLLDVLDKFHAHGTFFVTGKKVIKYPELIQRESREGHEVENHTFNHLDLRGLSTERINKEISTTTEAIHSVTGNMPTLFRPPGGYFHEKIVNSAKNLGYIVVLWSWHQDTKDWSKPGVKKIVNKVLKNTRNGDIVLFHDYDCGQTIKALTEILPKLEERGYQFVTVSELIKLRNRK
jgi:polysaccharide deacetylase family sporulation protein PdaB